MINVLLVDDHEIVRTGIKRLLDDVDDIKVIAVADSGEQAIKLVRTKKPDVVLMDVSMPGIGGMEATRRIKQYQPDLPIIVLTMYTDDPYPARLLKAGATGYLHKDCGVEEIVAAIRRTFSGQPYISPDIAQNLVISLLPGKEGSPLDALSERELQVMLMLVQGHKVQAISEKLCLSPKTVSTYRYRVFDKLGIRNDAELTRLAMRYGMLKGMD